jgi:aminoglycoside/choline kinase family phosphotransferase
MDPVAPGLERLVDGYLAAAGRPVGRRRITALTPDGSDRLYFRVTLADGTSLVAVDAAGTGSRSPFVSPAGISQNETFFRVREHLEGLGFPVPRLLAREPGGDYYLLEDLGDLSLYRWLADSVSPPAADEVAALYGRVLSLLLALQTRAVAGFDPAWAYAGGYYDYELIYDGELNYFLAAFVESWCGLKLSRIERDSLRREFARLAERAAALPGGYFLYRDFQSKNLLLQDGGIRLIDFQGARLGPLYYDLASLLNDPYVALPPSLRRALLAGYYAELRETLGRRAPGGDEFASAYNLFSLIRTLQALGAYGFLAGRGKAHFISFIAPALANLIAILNDPILELEFPVLTNLAGEMISAKV